MTGTVVAISGDIITFSQGIGSEACFGCMEQKCKGHVRHFIAKNSLGFSLNVGQVVEVEAPKSMLISQSLQVLLPPIIGFFGGFILTGILFTNSGEPARAMGGVVMFLLTGYVIYFMRKRNLQNAIPHITKVFPNGIRQRT